MKHAILAILASLTLAGGATAQPTLDEMAARFATSVPLPPPCEGPAPRAPTLPGPPTPAPAPCRP